MYKLYCKRVFFFVAETNERSPVSSHLAVSKCCTEGLTCVIQVFIRTP